MPQQIYSFENPLPFDGMFIAEEPVYDPVQTVFYDDRIDPGPCIICGVPHTACTGNEEWNQ